MPVVYPFCGYSYRPSLRSELPSLLAQPYDAIDARLASVYLKSSPYNIARIDAGIGVDGTGNELRANIGAMWRGWVDEKVVVSDGEECFYVYETRFPWEGQILVRRALIGAVPAAGYGTGAVLPHELTRPDVVASRAAWLEKTQVHASIILMLCDDKPGRLAKICSEVTAGPAWISASEKTKPDVLHSLWRVYGSDHNAAVRELVGTVGSFVIADGHHRYEAAVMRGEAEGRTGRQELIPCAIVPANDRGVLIRATHRYVSASNGESIIGALEKWFRIQEAECLDEVLGILSQDRVESSIGIYSNRRFIVVSLRQEHSKQHAVGVERIAAMMCFENEILRPLRQKGSGQDLQVDYLMDPGQLVSLVDRRGGVGVFACALRVDEVMRAARLGIRLPAKTTLFTPKVVSGLIMMCAATV